LADYIANPFVCGGKPKHVVGIRRAGGTLQGSRMLEEKPEYTN